MKKLMLAALSSLAMGAYAADDHKFYAGGGASLWNMDIDLQGREHINLASLDGIFGYEVLPWLSLEGRIGAGVVRDKTLTRLAYIAYDSDPDTGAAEYDQETLALESSLNYYASFFVKPELKNDVASFYGLVGFTTYDAEFEATTQVYSGTSVVVGEGDDAYTVETSFGATGEPTYSEFDESETSFSVGLGVGFFFKDRYTFNLEWKSLIQSQPVGESDGEVRMSGFSGNVTYSF